MNDNVKRAIEQMKFITEGRVLDNAKIQLSDLDFMDDLTSEEMLQLAEGLRQSAQKLKQNPPKEIYDDYQ